jgi:hypothetical protein
LSSIDHATVAVRDPFAGTMSASKPAELKDPMRC